MSAESATTALNFEKCSTVLIDIAGTTTSHSFVKDTLFAYIISNAEEYLKSHWEEDNVKEAIKLMQNESLEIEKAVAIIKELTEKADNNVGLKKLHALISQKGFESGALKASVFSDVPSALENWSKSRKIAIYSNGDVLGQKLLFKNTTEGDLTPNIHKYFDEAIGPKNEKESYEKIVKELGVKSEEVIFITDRIDEAKAAKTSEVPVILIKREGNEPLPEGAEKEFMVISSFKEVSFEKLKRKNEEDAIPVEEQPPSKVAKIEGSAIAGEKNKEQDKKTEEVSESMEVDVSEPKDEAKNEETPAAKTTEKSEGEEKVSEVVEPEEKMDQGTENDKEVTKPEQSNADDTEKMNVDVEKTDACEKDDKSKETEEKKEKPETEAENKSKESTIEKKESKEDSKEPSKLENKNSEHAPEKKVDSVETSQEMETTKTDDNSKESAKSEKPEAESKTETKPVVEKASESGTNSEPIKTDKDSEDVEKTKEVVESKPTEEKPKETENTPKETENKLKETENKSKETQEKTKETEGKPKETVEKPKETVEKPKETEGKPKQTEEKPKEVEEKPKVTQDKPKEAEDKLKETVDKTNETENNPKETVEKTKETEENPKDTEEKPKETGDKAEEKEKNDTEKGEAPKEQTQDAEVKVDEKEKIINEKENKSDLANGVETVTTNGDSVTKNTDEPEESPKVDEIKVKKVDEPVESNPPVAVEV